VAANRRNARRSTGPRTAEGKARASRNALKHGLCAGYGPLPSECEATFNMFLDELREELRPRTALQRLLFPQIANLLWNVQRLPQAQRDLFVRESGKAADDSEMLAASEVLARRFSDDPSNGFVLLGRYERSMQNALLRMIRQFHSLQKTHPTAPHADGERPCPPEGSQPAWSGRKAEQQRRWFDEQIERVHRGLPVEGSEYVRREVERLAATRGAGATKGGDERGRRGRRNDRVAITPTLSRRSGRGGETNPNEASGIARKTLALVGRRGFPSRRRDRG
jgi:hypothetical protein